MLHTDFDNNVKTPVAHVLVESVVRTALANALERSVDEISPASDLVNDLGLDSLGLIQVNIAIEEALGVSILSGESPEFALKTVGELTAFVAARAGISRFNEEGQPC